MARLHVTPTAAPSAPRPAFDWAVTAFYSALVAPDRTLPPTYDAGFPVPDTIQLGRRANYRYAAAVGSAVWGAVTLLVATQLYPDDNPDRHASQWRAAAWKTRFVDTNRDLFLGHADAATHPRQFEQALLYSERVWERALQTISLDVVPDDYALIVPPAFRTAAPGPPRDGMCYLRLVIGSLARTVAETLGPWPTVRELLDFESSAPSSEGRVLLRSFHGTHVPGSGTAHVDPNAPGLLAFGPGPHHPSATVLGSDVRVGGDLESADVSAPASGGRYHLSTVLTATTAAAVPLERMPAVLQLGIVWPHVRLTAVHISLVAGETGTAVVAALTPGRPRTIAANTAPTRADVLALPHAMSVTTTNENAGATVAPVAIVGPLDLELSALAAPAGGIRPWLVLNAVVGTNHAVRVEIVLDVSGVAAAVTGPANLGL